MAAVVSRLLSTHGLFLDPDKRPKDFMAFAHGTIAKNLPVMGGFSAFLRMSK